MAAVALAAIKLALYIEGYTGATSEQQRFTLQEEQFLSSRGYNPYFYVHTNYVLFIGKWFKGQKIYAKLCRVISCLVANTKRDIVQIKTKWPPTFFPVRIGSSFLVFLV